MTKPIAAAQKGKNKNKNDTMFHKTPEVCMVLLLIDNL